MWSVRRRYTNINNRSPTTEQTISSSKTWKNVFMNAFKQSFSGWRAHLNSPTLGNVNELGYSRPTSSELPSQRHNHGRDLRPATHGALATRSAS